MSKFKKFADLVNAKFLKMSQTGNLFVANASTIELQNLYQTSFTDEENPMFLEARVHKCNTCDSFIKRLGRVVSITEQGDIDTIWNIKGAPAPYNRIAKVLHSFVSSKGISSVFITDERTAGKEYNLCVDTAKAQRFDHFYADIAESFVSLNPLTERSKVDASVAMFNRILREIDISTYDVVINILHHVYKGVEFLTAVEKMRGAKVKYEESNKKKTFAFMNYQKYPTGLRNTLVGTLLVDVQKGDDDEKAIRKYLSKANPENYKVSDAVYSPRQEAAALQVIEELGLAPSLDRRIAKLDDVDVKDVLYAADSSKAVMKNSIADILSNGRKPVTAGGKGRELSIADFLANVLPKAKEIELLVENRHANNFITLVTGTHDDAPDLFSWKGNGSWSYANELASSSMVDNLKRVGAEINADSRFTIQWNDNDDNHSDLDAHCIEPDNTRIYYGSYKGKNKVRSRTGANLDHDIQTPNGVSNENIVHRKRGLMLDGVHTYEVHNYHAHRNNSGFTAEYEFCGKVVSYTYDKPLRSKEKVEVCRVTIKNGELVRVESDLPSSETSKEIWSINTLTYKKVSAIMLSPNYWDGQGVGEKHYIFTLDGCQNPSRVRGFYNAFLRGDLRPYRKQFEMLSQRMLCEHTEDQLSGLGFTETQVNKVTVKVDNVPYIINFGKRG